MLELKGDSHMDITLKRQIQRTIKNSVNGAMTYTDDVSSSKIEGQYGGETWEEKFTEITFYLHYTPQIEKIREILEIIQICTQECRFINQGSGLEIKIYLFDEKNNSIKQIRTKLHTKNPAVEKFYLQELEDFKNGVKVQTIQSLAKLIGKIDGNGFAIFITGKCGCDLGEKELRRIKKQSIWFKLNNGTTELFQGLPKKVKENDEQSTKEIQQIENIENKEEFTTNTWLHRISHCYEVSKPLLDQNYLTIGFADYVEYFEMHKGDLKILQDNFENDMETVYRPSFRQRYNLRKFLFEFEVGDQVLVPSWGNFSLYKIIEKAKPITQLPKDVILKTNTDTDFNCDGLLSYKLLDEVVDLGFFIRVEEIKLDIPRDQYCNTPLISRMKLRNATANITNLQKDIEESIARFVKNKPIDFHVEAVHAIKENLIKTILSKRTPYQFEELVQWYLKKIGADETQIPAKNERGKSDGADADVIATFEMLKCIVYVQVKQHNGNTSDWAVQQIAKYKDQFEDKADEYTYLTWVISSAQFTDDVYEKAKSAGVRLFNGEQFAEMLIDVGFKGINTAFSK